MKYTHTADARIRKTEVENAIKDLFDRNHQKLVNDKGRRIGVQKIVETVCLTRKAYIDTLNADKTPERATLIKLAVAFLFGAEDLVMLMELKGYVFPAPDRLTDELVLAIFTKGFNTPEKIYDRIAPLIDYTDRCKVCAKEDKAIEAVANLFDAHHEDLVDSDGKKLGIKPILSPVGLGRKSYYAALNCDSTPSKETLILLACSFFFSGDDLIELMQYKGYLFPAPASYEDELILEAFDIGEYGDPDDIHDYVSRRLDNPQYHLTLGSRKIYHRGH